jgi:uncharacterized MAPEG superfamily protein
MTLTVSLSALWKISACIALLFMILRVAMIEVYFLGVAHMRDLENITFFSNVLDLVL